MPSRQQAPTPICQDYPDTLKPSDTPIYPIFADMKIIFLSDTHNKHRKVNLPPGDILLHGGDVCNGREEQLRDFLDWLASQPHSFKVFIGGNMDRPLEKDPDYWRTQLPENTFYLENELLELEGLHIWGSPMIPQFVGAFNRQRGPEIDAYWQEIPAGLDILLTHTPPFQILDRTSLGMHVGCKDLARRLPDLHPSYHLFGHVHEAYGMERSEHTTFMNGSFVRGRFRKPNEPFILEIS